MIAHRVNSIRRRCCVTYGNLSSLQLPSVCARAGRLVASNGGLLKSAKRNGKMFCQAEKASSRNLFPEGKNWKSLLSLAFLQTSGSKRDAQKLNITYGRVVMVAVPSIRGSSLEQFGHSSSRAPRLLKRAIFIDSSDRK